MLIFVWVGPRRLRTMASDRKIACRMMFQAVQPVRSPVSNETDLQNFNLY